MAIRLALVAGPMYDGLREALEDGYDVETIVCADHPTLNREVEQRLQRGERLDLISTHSKYAPSQAQWLRPLDELVSAQTLAGLSDRALELCHFEGRVFSLPRLIDVRVMWVRSDRIDPPATWADLLTDDVAFGFPGRDSGLFGTFFELTVGAGGALFASDGTPTISTREAEWAVDVLCELASRCPAEHSKWHYDEVDQALMDGDVDAAGAWPGAFDRIRASPLVDVLEPHPYPAGTARRVTYAGCHSWAIPNSCKELDGALQLLDDLAGHRLQSEDSKSGAIPANDQARRELTPTSEIDARRLELTSRAVAEQMITYPPLAPFPAIEDAGWRALQRAMRGEASAKEVLTSVQAVAEQVLA
jgi:multiple sugar transport system substrate-binding protein